MSEQPVFVCRQCQSDRFFELKRYVADYVGAEAPRDDATHDAALRIRCVRCGTEYEAIGFVWRPIA